MAFAKKIEVSVEKIMGRQFTTVIPDGYLPKAARETLRANTFRWNNDFKCYLAPHNDATVQVAKEVKHNVETYAITAKPADVVGTKATKAAPVKSIAEQAAELLGLGFTKAQVAKMIGDKATA